MRKTRKARREDAVGDPALLGLERKQTNELCTVNDADQFELVTHRCSIQYNALVIYEYVMVQYLFLACM